MPEELKELLARLLAQPGAGFHLVGVSGSGMIGLARLLLQKSMRVSGSDLIRTPEIDALEKMGLKFFTGHAAGNVGEVVALVYSSAVVPENSERASAEARGIPCIRRGEMLAALAVGRRVLAIAGMHGKTTSAAMLTHILRAAGLHPSYYVGASMPSLGFSASLEGEWFVIETDESDGTFTLIEPEHTLLLNVEREHVDYYGNESLLWEAFGLLAKKTRGRLVYCQDDAGAARVAATAPNAVAFSVETNAAFCAQDILLEPSGTKFRAVQEGSKPVDARLVVPGRHNVSNALGAAAMATLAGVPLRAALASLSDFRGAGRRFEYKLELEQIRVVDDYAHHPTEIRATIAAAKALQPKRLLVLFQPHRYTRTQALLADFAQAFAGADRLWISEIYAASEPEIPGVTGSVLAEAVRAGSMPSVEFVADLKTLHQRVSREAQPGDLILVLGAGDITQVADSLAEELRSYFELSVQLTPASKLVRQEPMAKHTTMRVGGPAQFWFEPADEADLAAALRWASQHGIHVTPLGRGSNLIVRDGGIRGLCVHLAGPHFSRVEVQDDRITAGAGARLKVIVAEAKKHDLGGFEFMEGIPGNLGGALRMNAGAMQGWTMEVIESVRSMDLQGNVREDKTDALEVHYRNVPHFRQHIALSAVLRGVANLREVITQKLKSYSEKRWGSQPAAPSAGCIFKNPGPLPAGKLIDELGLKNAAVGAARVSDVHGNFIVNDGGATARDVLALIEQIKQKARGERGLELEMEAIVLGEDV